MTSEEARTLIVLREMGAITNADYRTLHSADTLSASFRLRRLRDFGLIEQKGRGNATYYVPTEKLLHSAINKPETSAIIKGATEILPIESAEQASLLSTELAYSTSPIPYKQAYNTSPKPYKLAYNIVTVQEQLPAELSEKMQKIGKKTSSADIKQVIKDLCSIKAFTINQLSYFLKRHPNYVRQTYLLPMLNAGELEAAHPESPTHPLQAYKTKIKQEIEL